MMSPRARLNDEFDRVERIITIAQAGGCSDQGVEVAIEAVRSGADADKVLPTLLCTVADPHRLAATAERLGMPIAAADIEDVGARLTARRINAARRGNLPRDLEAEVMTLVEKQLGTRRRGDLGDQLADVPDARRGKRPRDREDEIMTLTEQRLGRGPV